MIDVGLVRVPSGFEEPVRFVTEPIGSLAPPLKLEVLVDTELSGFEEPVMEPIGLLEVNPLTKLVELSSVDETEDNPCKAELNDPTLEVRPLTAEVADDNDDNESPNALMLLAVLATVEVADESADKEEPKVFTLLVTSLIADKDPFREFKVVPSELTPLVIAGSVPCRVLNVEPKLVIELVTSPTDERDPCKVPVAEDKEPSDEVSEPRVDATP